MTILFATALLAAAAAPTEYRIAPANNSRFELFVYKTGLMSGRKHHFAFERYHGTLLYDSARPENSQVRLTIESASATLKDDWLSGKDFKKVQQYALEEKMLAAGRYPAMTFVSTNITPAGEGKYRLHGTLTIRDIPKPVEVLVTINPGEPLVFEGTATVDMTAYGLKPPGAALGLIGTRKEMTVSFSLRAQPASPGSARARPGQTEAADAR